MFHESENESNGTNCPLNFLIFNVVSRALPTLSLPVNLKKKNFLQ